MGHPKNETFENETWGLYVQNTWIKLSDLGVLCMPDLSDRLVVQLSCTTTALFDATTNNLKLDCLPFLVHIQLPQAGSLWSNTTLNGYSPILLYLNGEPGHAFHLKNQKLV